MENKYHVLMIDDDQMIQRMFGAKLAANNFEVMYAHNGDEGREMARRFKPDVILLDIRMPKEDGQTIAKSLKGTDLTKDIPIIFLTNEDLKPEAEQWVKELWVSDYIHKSVDLNELVERVNKVIGDSKNNK